ncbi:MAG: hypothetical protein ACP5OP_02660 [Leptospirillia bacterium]
MNKKGFWIFLFIFLLGLFRLSPMGGVGSFGCDGCGSISAPPFFLDVSFSDLKKSEKYLRQDLGLSSVNASPDDPLWERSLKTHPILVFLSAVMFFSGGIAFFIIIRRQNLNLREGMELVRKNAGRFGGGGYGHSSGGSVPLKEVIKATEEDVWSGRDLPPEKAVKRMDSVLDSLRVSLGAGGRSARLTLFRYDEPDDQFRICGVSSGEDFTLLGTSISPPEIVFNSPLRTLTFVPKSGTLGLVDSWVYPFVGDGGEFCVLMVEMTVSRPPDNWQDNVKESLHLLKSLIVRQESGGTDPTLTTKDSTGSLDYRATMNRLMEALSKTKKMGIPFSMIAFRIDNQEEVEKRYGAAPLELAWSRFTSTVSATLRPTDWVMRPRPDLLLIQLLEAGEAQGQAVLNRILKSLTKFSSSGTLEKGLHYHVVLVPYPLELSPSVGTFFEQILLKVDGPSSVEGTFYYS